MPLTLKPGDHLLYSSLKSKAWYYRLFAWLCRWVTRQDVSHVEVYIGNGRTVAARLSGVNEYDVELENLVHVLRPNKPMDLVAGMAWFLRDAKGRPYSIHDLIDFLSLNGQNPDDPSKMVCSELVARFDRASHFEPFSSAQSSEATNPGHFLLSSCLDEQDLSGGVVCG